MIPFLLSFLCFSSAQYIWKPESVSPGVNYLSCSVWALTRKDFLKSFGMFLQTHIPLLAAAECSSPRWCSPRVQPNSQAEHTIPTGTHPKTHAQHTYAELATHPSLPSSWAAAPVPAVASSSSCLMRMHMFCPDFTPTPRFLLLLLASLLQSPGITHWHIHPPLRPLSPVLWLQLLAPRPPQAHTEGDPLSNSWEQFNEETCQTVLMRTRAWPNILYSHLFTHNQPTLSLCPCFFPTVILSLTLVPPLSIPMLSCVDSQNVLPCIPQVLQWPSLPFPLCRLTPQRPFTHQMSVTQAPRADDL